MSIGNPTPKTIEELALLLDDEASALVKTAWCRGGNGDWSLRLLELVIAEARDSRPPISLSYPDVLFSAEQLEGGEVSEWLRAGAITMADKRHDLNRLNQLHWDRRESGARTGFEVIEWPSYECRLDNLPNVEPNPPLVAPDAPSFASFYSGVAWFFGLAAGSNNSYIPSSATLRWVDRRARINSVDFTDDSILVEVEGESLEGVVVELAGDRPGPSQTLTKDSPSPTTVAFQIPNGLPEGSWLLLRSGPEWLDRRFLSSPSGDETSVELPARTRLEAFVSGRENNQVEFKQSIPDSDATRAKVMKTVCAFGNGVGGSLLFGISDDYEITGIAGSKASRDADTLSNLIDDWVEPAPEYAFEFLPIDGTSLVVIELTVGAGGALHGSSRPNEPRRIYIRHHARSVPARPREIEEIVRSRTPTSEPPR